MVAKFFMGALRFCDDLIFLAPTSDAVNLRLDNQHRFAAKYYLQSNQAIPCKTMSVAGQAEVSGPDARWETDSMA